MRRTILIAAAAAMAVTAVACSSDSDDPTAPTATPTKQGIPVGEPTPGGPKADDPTPSPEPAKDEAPIVEWLTLNHGGAGAVVLVLETNVPTTATARGVAPPGTENLPAAISDSSVDLSRSHTLSIGTGGMDMMFEVEVSDTQGRVATATVESGAIVQMQYWARFGEDAPTVTLDGGRAATATWANLHGQGEPAPGLVVVLSKRAGCTTAEACIGGFSGQFEGEPPTISADKTLERHEVEFLLPDVEHDFQVLLVGSPAADVRAFYQVDILAGDLE